MNSKNNLTKKYSDCNSCSNDKFYCTICINNPDADYKLNDYYEEPL